MINKIKQHHITLQIEYAINKILSIKINILSLFYFIILLLPLIQTELRIRIGAGWQLYIPLIFLLFIAILVKKKKDFINYFISIFILFLLMIISDIYGYMVFHDYPLTSNLISQIVSLEARMGVESVRYVTSIVFFFITLYLIKSFTILLKSTKMFLYAVLFQAFYGAYEFLVKFVFTFLPLINSKAYSHGTYRVFGTFYEPSQYGQFILIGMLVLILYKRVLKQFNIYDNSIFVKHYKKLLLLFLIALLLSLSRAAMLAGFIVYIIHLISSLYSLRKIVKVIIFSGIITLLFTMYVNIVLTDQQYQNWIYLLTSDTGNGLIARINGVIDGLIVSISYSFTNYLGIGQGTLILTSGNTPFLLRLISETGILVSFGYLIFISSILYNNSRNIIFKDIKHHIFLIVIALLIIQLNYSSTNDPWIWFLLALLYKFPKLIKEQNSIK